ncbi:hypothetical protein V7S43_006118 [Phytophthora oleae]|uniref:Uncharacterized protein n=1 Tax=Phytophthora oleae TaxID=2107226 RepID=A0ABD3FSX4_9STRA
MISFQLPAYENKFVEKIKKEKKNNVKDVDADNLQFFLAKTVGGPWLSSLVLSYKAYPDMERMIWTWATSGGAFNWNFLLSHRHELHLSRRPACRRGPSHCPT